MSGSSNTLVVDRANAGACQKSQFRGDDRGGVTTTPILPGHDGDDRGVVNKDTEKRATATA